MQIKLGEKEYTLRFGLKFIRELDEKYYAERNGIKYGAALELKIPFVLAGDTVTLAEFLYSATATEEKRPTQDQVDYFIEETDDIEALFDEVHSELKKSNVTKKRTEEMEALLKIQEELEEEMKEEKAPKKVQKKPTKK